MAALTTIDPFLGDVVMLGLDAETLGHAPGSWPAGPWHVR